MRFLGQPILTDCGRYYLALVVCLLVTLFMLNMHRTSSAARWSRCARRTSPPRHRRQPFSYKLLAFWCSSFIGGVAGAVLAFSYYQAVTPEQFHLEVSIQLLAMVIVGGLGSVLGSFFGAGLMLLAPIVLNNLIGWLAVGSPPAADAEILAHIPLVLYGALIIGFLLFEPLGLAKIYDNVRNYLLVWPFRHARH